MSNMNAQNVKYEYQRMCILPINSFIYLTLFCESGLKENKNWAQQNKAKLNSVYCNISLKQFVPHAWNMPLNWLFLSMVTMVLHKGWANTTSTLFIYLSSVIFTLNCFFVHSYVVWLTEVNLPLDTVSAGDHWDRRMSRQMLPLLLILGW